MKKIIISLVIFNITFLLFSQDHYRNLNAEKEIIDVSKYQTNKAEEIIFNIPAAVTTALSISLEDYSPLNCSGVHSEDSDKYFEQIISILVSWTDNDFLKIKSLYDWICYNIDYDKNCAKGINMFIYQNYQAVLKDKKAVCAGFSFLFNEMAKRAGFEVYYIGGYARNSGIRIKVEGEILNVLEIGQIFERHAWNAVKINDVYYLVDTTWGINNSIMNYDSEYFLMDPNLFVMTHYPEDKKWLLTENYISRREFMAERYDGLLEKFILSNSIEEKETILNENPYLIDKNEVVPLIARKGDIETFNLLLQHGIDINYPYNVSTAEDISIIRKTALLIAIENEHLDLVKYLIENGAQ